MQLPELNLTQNESQIFLCLAKNGHLGIAQIAKETGLNRPYLYYALERMIEKGVVFKLQEDGKTRYAAQEFEQIISSEEERLASLKRLAKDITALRQNKEPHPTIEVLKGKYVAKAILKRAIAELRPGAQIFSTGVNEEEMESVEPIYLQKTFNLMKERKVKEKAIIREGTKSLPYAWTTEYRSLSPATLGDTGQIIYQDTVINIIYGQPMHAIIIKSQRIADAEAAKFRILWKEAEPL